MRILSTRQARIWVVLAGATVAVAACGGGGGVARNDASVQAPQGSSQSQSQSQAQAPGTGTSPQQQNPAQNAPGSAANAPGAAAPGAAPGGSAPGAGHGNLPPAPGLPKPGVPNPGAPVPGKNFASDVGVTANQINIGIINIASANRSLGPPIALASQRMTDALVHYINDNGGVAGRRLNLLTCDDGGDVTRARACYEKLKAQVFAFVPSETFVTDVIHDTLAKDKVPWMSWGWFKSEYTDPYMFPCHANGMREASNVSKWIAEQRPPADRRHPLPERLRGYHRRRPRHRIFQQHGIRVVQKVGQEWDSPDESQHVLAMRVANPDADRLLLLAGAGGQVLPRRPGPELVSAQGLLRQPPHRRPRLRPHLRRLHQGPRHHDHLVGRRPAPRGSPRPTRTFPG